MMRNSTKDQILAAIAAYKNNHHTYFSKKDYTRENSNYKRAAVLIPLLESDGHLHILLTKRSQDLVEHRGQVAYPGGAWEQGDDNLEMTALREMYEEIGVKPGDVHIFGDLGEMPIITGYLVQIFVGEIPWPYPLRINSDEVESAFIVPLHWLSDPDHHTIQNRSFAGREIPVIFFDHYDGYQLWGASAEMTMILLTALDLIN